METFITLIFAVYCVQITIALIRYAYGAISSIYSFNTMLIPFYGFKEIFKF